VAFACSALILRRISLSGCLAPLDCLALSWNVTSRENDIVAQTMHSIQKSKAGHAVSLGGWCVRWFFALAAVSLAAQPTTQEAASSNPSTLTGEKDRFAVFEPSRTRIDHSIDYGIWDFALKQLVITMGPVNRKRPIILSNSMTAGGSRIRQGHNSLYRTEGSMMAFSLLDREAIASFTEYREDLQRIAGELDIATLPRNEQLAFWFNLHNVTLVEQIAKEWPFRQPRDLMIDGVPLDEAQLITIRGVKMSLKDIRENIVYRNWSDPRVIYGFWRGEIGSPSLGREAFNALNVNYLLTQEADYYVNSMRGTEKRGKTLHISTLYDEVREFYFPDFENDVRRHIENFANDDVLEFVQKTDRIKPSIREYDIADLSGGYRAQLALQGSRPGLSAGAAELLRQRQVKLQRLERKKKRTGRVFFTPLVLPGDDPANSEVK